VFVGGGEGGLQASRVPQYVVAPLLAAVYGMARRCRCREEHQRGPQGPSHRARSTRHLLMRILEFSSGSKF